MCIPPACNSLIKFRTRQQLASGSSTHDCPCSNANTDTHREPDLEQQLHNLEVSVADRRVQRLPVVTVRRVGARVQNLREMRALHIKSLQINLFIMRPYNWCNDQRKCSCLDPDWLEPRTSLTAVGERCSTAHISADASSSRTPFTSPWNAARARRSAASSPWEMASKTEPVNNARH